MREVQDPRGDSSDNIITNTAWKDEATGFSCAEPGREIPPVGDMPADYIVCGSGIAMHSKATERFLMNAPMQARHPDFLIFSFKLM